MSTIARPPATQPAPSRLLHASVKRDLAFYVEICTAFEKKHKRWPSPSASGVEFAAAGVGGYSGWLIEKELAFPCADLEHDPAFVDLLAHCLSDGERRVTLNTLDPCYRSTLGVAHIQGLLNTLDLSDGGLAERQEFDPADCGTIALAVPQSIWEEALVISGLNPSRQHIRVSARNLSLSVTDGLRDFLDHIGMVFGSDRATIAKRYALEITELGKLYIRYRDIQALRYAGTVELGQLRAALAAVFSDNRDLIEQSSRPKDAASSTQRLKSIGLDATASAHKYRDAIPVFADLDAKSWVPKGEPRPRPAAADHGSRCYETSACLGHEFGQAPGFASESIFDEQARSDGTLDPDAPHDVELRRQLAHLVPTKQSLLMPAKPLSRRADIKRLVEQYGGRYSSHKEQFHFDEGVNTAEVLTRLVEGRPDGFVDLPFSATTTPDEARKLCKDAGDLEGAAVLIPYAGLGVVADAARRRGAEVVTVESWSVSVERLLEKGYKPVSQDLMGLSPDDIGTFDAVVTKLGNSASEDASIFSQLCKFVRPGGTISVIMSAAWQHADSPEIDSMREILSEQSVELRPAKQVGANGKNDGGQLIRVTVRDFRPTAAADAGIARRPGLS